jgi:hypothetical protein
MTVDKNSEQYLLIQKELLYLLVLTFFPILPDFPNTRDIPFSYAQIYFIRITTVLLPGKRYVRIYLTEKSKSKIHLAGVYPKK